MKKNLKRFGLSLLSVVLILLTGVLLSPVEPDQELLWQGDTPIPVELEEANLLTKFDSLYALYGHKKELPEGYEVQALLALSVYPELQDVKVKFEFSKTVNAPLEANFAIPTLLLPRKHRKYRVIISSAEEGFFSEANFKNINFNGQVGILAHELGHVIYYHDCNIFQIGNWGLQYLLKKDFAATHERETDKVVVYRGLGWQLLQSTLFFNQYFGERKKMDKTTKELAIPYIYMETPVATQENGYYLSIDGVFREMRSIDAYMPSFKKMEE